MRRSVVVACLAAISLLAACGDSDDGSTATTTGGGTSTTIAAKRIAAYITKVDINEGELTYDEIAFLTGDAANAAYHRDNPDEPDDVPNDYYIDNPDKATKTVAIAPNARVELNILAVENSSSKNQGASVAELADAFVKGKLTPDGRDRSEFVATRPFWITLSEDVVINIEEQYTP